MNFKSLSRIRKPLRILLSISLLAAGLCLMGACLWIFRSGLAPFSRESVAAAFRYIQLPVYLSLGLILLTVPAELLLSKEEAPLPPARQLRMLLRRTQARIDLSRCDDDLRKQVLALRSDRRLYRGIGWAILFFSCVLFLTYGFNADNYHPVHIDRSVIRAMFWLLPCTLIPFLYGLFAERKNHASMVKELELLKTAPKESRVAPAKPVSKQDLISWIRLGLLVLSVMILLGGIFAGGAKEVLTKAANICTECIGLG